ncbi:Hypothetical protein SCF082_LOCUS47006 [Durusdinium trenchii]|uniref:Uncharacterized protein n=1 Tax=Durusdinium trenchii TaxID=1381693 RepID=A0ABP0RMK1_9DINO
MSMDAREVVAWVLLENHVIQSQAIELLTDFLEPQMAMQPASSGRQARESELRTALAELCADPRRAWRGRAAVFPRSFDSSIRLLAAAIGWLRPQNGQSVPEATVPPEVHEAFQALQRCADGARLGPEMRQVAGELLEETRTWT